MPGLSLFLAGGVGGRVVWGARGQSHSALPPLPPAREQPLCRLPPVQLPDPSSHVRKGLTRPHLRSRCAHLRAGRDEVKAFPSTVSVCAPLAESPLSPSSAGSRSSSRGGETACQVRKENPPFHSRRNCPPASRAPKALPPGRLCRSPPERPPLAPQPRRGRCVRALLPKGHVSPIAAAAARKGVDPSAG